MPDRRRPTCARAVGFVLAASVIGSAAHGGPSDVDRAAAAIRLYDAGTYAEAGLLLAALDAEGQAPGPLLYRLHYCQRAAGEEELSGATLRRAVEVLSADLASAEDTETAFYLVNAYQSLGQGDEAERVATEAIARLERGEIAGGEGGVANFRVGKLYADRGDFETAGKWYTLALAAFREEPDSHPAYDRWATRYVADLAFRDRDFRAAAEHYGRLASKDEAETVELDLLATARARIGEYTAAAEAWKQQERAETGDSTRPRYCWHLAEKAQRYGPLAERAPDGRAWIELDQAQLEALLTEQVEVVRKARESALAAGAKPKRRHELEAEVARARTVFLAAGLEYALRGLPIRETAFIGGYAPLIFHDAEWGLPAAPAD